MTAERDDSDGRSPVLLCAWWAFWGKYLVSSHNIDMKMNRNDDENSPKIFTVIPFMNLNAMVLYFINFEEHMIKQNFLGRSPRPHMSTPPTTWNFWGRGVTSVIWWIPQLHGHEAVNTRNAESNQACGSIFLISGLCYWKASKTRAPQTVFRAMAGALSRWFSRLAMSRLIFLIEMGHWKASEILDRSVAGKMSLILMTLELIQCIRLDAMHSLLTID